MRELDDADLDAVNGGYGNVWMACYLTVRHILNDMDKATFELWEIPREFCWSANSEAALMQPVSEERLAGLIAAGSLVAAPLRH
jgi:hypothetical protein